MINDTVRSEWTSHEFLLAVLHTIAVFYDSYTIAYVGFGNWVLGYCWNMHIDIRFGRYETLRFLVGIGLGLICRYTRVRSKLKSSI
jgi:hypothetical protein